MPEDHHNFLLSMWVKFYIYKTNKRLRSIHFSSCFYLKYVLLNYCRTIQNHSVDMPRGDLLKLPVHPQIKSSEERKNVTKSVRYLSSLKTPPIIWQQKNNISDKYLHY